MRLLFLLESPVIRGFPLLFFSAAPPSGAQWWRLTPPSSARKARLRGRFAARLKMCYREKEDLIPPVSQGGYSRFLGRRGWLLRASVRSVRPSERRSSRPR